MVGECADKWEIKSTKKKICTHTHGRLCVMHFSQKKKGIRFLIGFLGVANAHLEEGGSMTEIELLRKEVDELKEAEAARSEREKAAIELEIRKLKAELWCLETRDRWFRDAVKNDRDTKVLMDRLLGRNGK